MAKKVNKTRCTVVSGAPRDDLMFIKEHIDPDSFIIAADSGYLKCKELGIRPDEIIGDFDSSARPDMEMCTDRVFLDVEKAHTDTFAAVRGAVFRGYKEIEIFGAIGSRVDHTYSNILCLDFCRKHGVKCTILNRNNRISLIEGEGKVYRDYQWFSLFAFLGDCKGVKIDGAHYGAGFYGADSLDFAVGDQFGQSNYVEGEFATVTCESGILLLIESND